MTFPRIQPIIPASRKEPFDDLRWLFDFKYDGFRGLCYLERGRCRFISRNGNVLSRFEALADQVAGVLDVDGAILDGEVIAADETGRPNFTTSCGARGRLRTWPSIFCGSMASTCDHYPSASVAGDCGASCQRDRRSSSKRCRLSTEGASSST